MGCFGCGDGSLIMRVGETAGGIVHGAVARGKLWAGLDVAPQPIISDRLLKCLACEYRDPGTSHCNKCPGLVKCPVHLKARVASESCPDERWGATMLTA